MESEENKDSVQSITTSQNGTTPQKSLFTNAPNTTTRIVLRDILIILGVLPIFGIGVGAFTLLSIGKAVTKTPSVCTERTTKIQTVADNLKVELSHVIINGINPVAITNIADKNCIDGSGNVSATAVYNLPAPEAVVIANFETILSFDLAPNQMSQVYALDNGGNSAYNSTSVDFVSTKLKARNIGNTYTVRYWLTTPVPCSALIEKMCTQNYTTVQSNGLMNRPVNKISVVLTSNVN